MPQTKLTEQPSENEEESYQIPKESYIAKTSLEEQTVFHVKKIEIENFKSISTISVELPRIGILTGPNNCGKSTILQAITLAFECLARNTDISKMKIKDSGSSVQEVSSVPVNHPRNLWHNNKWQEARAKRIPIKIKLEFINGTYFTAVVRFTFGFLNLSVIDFSDNLKKPEELKKLLNSSPVLIPGVPGLLRHEFPVHFSLINANLNAGFLSQVLRNAIQQIKVKAPSKYEIIKECIKRHFDIKIDEIEFDESTSLEISIPYEENDNEFEIISAGSGFHQILQLVTFLSWSSSSIILLDEPDSHLHTSLQKKLFVFLDDLSRKLNLQLLISTHSRDFLAASPINSIIPIDLSLREIKPMKSMESLLAEYRRQTEISNMELACLYNSKKCLFVEGPTDEELLISFAEKIGGNVINSQFHAVIFPFKGKDKLYALPDLIRLFQNMIGSEVKWFLIRDRDALATEVVEKFKDKIQRQGITNFHIWSRYELENYLLDFRPITRLVRSQTGTEIPEERIQKLIEECTQEVLRRVEPTIITENQNECKRLELENWNVEGAKFAASYIRSAGSSIENLLSTVPGKDVLAKLTQEVQTQFGTNLRAIDIVGAMTNEEIPSEITSLFAEINRKLS